MEVDVDVAAGSNSDGDMDVDAGQVQQQAARRVAARRAKRWAVSVQRRAPRPAACKRCGEVFDEGAVRLCAWAQQNRGKFYHPACCLDAGSGDMFSAVGRASDAQVTEIRTAVENRTDATTAAEMEPGAAESTPVLESAWQDQRLPRRRFWEDLSWDALLRLGRTTFVQVPDRLHSSFTHARTQALEALADARAAGRDEEAEWKCSLLFEVLLLSRGPSGTTCGELLEERLAWWREARWEALWGAVAGPPTPPPEARQQTKKAQATRVHTLAAAGEEGRALAATSAETPAPRTQETYDRLGDLFLKTSTTHPTAPTTPLQQDPAFQREVALEVKKLLNRPAKLTAPGLFGTRLEHLAACAADPRALELLAWAASLLATGDAPASVFTALRRGEVVGLAKKDGGVRPLVIGACLRRLALRAVVRVRKEALCALAGAH